MCSQATQEKSVPAHEQTQLFLWLRSTYKYSYCSRARSCAAAQMRSQAAKRVAVLAHKNNDSHAHAHVLHRRCAPKPQKQWQCLLPNSTMPMCTLMCCIADALPSRKNVTVLAYKKRRCPCARSCAAAQMRSQATKTVAVLAHKKQRCPCARTCAAAQMRSQATKTVAVLAHKKQRCPCARSCAALQMRSQAAKRVAVLAHKKQRYPCARTCAAAQMRSQAAKTVTVLTHKKQRCPCARSCTAAQVTVWLPGSADFVFLSHKNPEGAGGPEDEARVAELSGESLTRLIAAHEQRYDQHFEQVRLCWGLLRTSSAMTSIFEQVRLCWCVG